ncbi:MAG: hypothetical protein PHE67_05305 [Campylobacterales bacterium]|nr:hypothetical protein [Campylobacterales bacterium]
MATIEIKKAILEVVTSKVAQRIKGGFVHAFVLPLICFAQFGLFGALSYIVAMGLVYNLAFGEDREEARNSFLLVGMGTLIALVVIGSLGGGVQ